MTGRTEESDGDGKPARSNTDSTARTENNADDKSAVMGDLHTCGICFQLYNDSNRLPKVLSCGHTNCVTCLNSWLKHNSSLFPMCAVCRKVTHKPISSLPNNFQLLQVLRRMDLVDSKPQSVHVVERERANGTYESTETTTVAHESHPGTAAVCEQIDEHMHVIISLLEAELERLTSEAPDEEEYDYERRRLIRAVQHAISELLSRWDTAKSSLLSIRRQNSSQRTTVRFRADIPDIVNELSELNDALANDGSDRGILGPRVDEDEIRFDRIHDFLGLDYETPPYDYSDFSLFGSETSHETLSASETSSVERLSTLPEESNTNFPHISTFDGPFGRYSYCNLCQCRLSTNHEVYRTHVLGRRHQLALAQVTDNTVAELTEAMRLLGLDRNRSNARGSRMRRNQAAPLARRFVDGIVANTAASHNSALIEHERQAEDRSEESAIQPSGSNHSRAVLRRQPFARRRRTTTRGNFTAQGPHDPHQATSFTSLTVRSSTDPTRDQRRNNQHFNVRSLSQNEETGMRELNSDGRFGHTWNRPTSSADTALQRNSYASGSGAQSRRGNDSVRDSYDSSLYPSNEYGDRISSYTVSYDGNSLHIGNFSGPGYRVDMAGSGISFIPHN